MAVPAKQIVDDVKGLFIPKFRKGQIAAITRYYGESWDELQAILLSPTATEWNRARAARLLEQVDVTLAAMDAETAQFYDAAIPPNYRSGQNIAAEQIRRLAIAKTVTRTAPIHGHAIQVIADSAAQDMVGATGSMGRVAKQYIRRTQLVTSNLGGFEQDLSAAIAKGVIQGDAITGVKDRVLKVLRDQIKDGRVVQAGGRIQAGARWFTPESYAELVARTRTREAVTQGTLNQAREFEMDLVIWDVHELPCPICRSFAGRVFSISGESKDFPKLGTMPPVHPNCECTLHPTTRGHLKRHGTLNKLIELSKDPDRPILGFEDYERVLGVRNVKRPPVPKGKIKAKTKLKAKAKAKPKAKVKPVGPLIDTAVSKSQIPKGTKGWDKFVYRERGTAPERWKED